MDIAGVISRCLRRSGLAKYAVLYRRHRHQFVINVRNIKQFTASNFRKICMDGGGMGEGVLNHLTSSVFIILSAASICHFSINTFTSAKLNELNTIFVYHEKIKKYGTQVLCRFTVHDISEIRCRVNQLTAVVNKCKYLI